MVRAPFILHTVPVKLSTGQAQGEKWYVVPFSVWKRRVYTGAVSKCGTLLTRVKFSFDYALGAGQYVGSMNKDSWRSL